MGNEQDKSKLETNQANTRVAAIGKKRNRPSKNNPLYPDRQRKRKRASNPAPRRTGNNGARTNEGNGEGEDAFQNAFGRIELTHAQQQRADESEEVVRQEMEEEQKASERQRAAVGDAVGQDGTLLHVHQPIGLPRNCGDSSAIERRLHTERALEAVLPAAATRRAVAATARTTNRATTATEAPTTAGVCAVAGCTWDVLVGDHPCYNKCGRYVHNLCAQTNNLCSEDNPLNMYCSLECKQNKE